MMSSKEASDYRSGKITKIIIIYECMACAGSGSDDSVPYPREATAGYCPSCKGYGEHKRELTHK